MYLLDTNLKSWSPKGLYLCYLKGQIMWQEINNKLVREFRFKDFQEAFTFLTRVAFIAERRNHHPQIYNVFNCVKLELCTHDAGDIVTDADRELAAEIGEILG